MHSKSSTLENGDALLCSSLMCPEVCQTAIQHQTDVANLFFIAFEFDVETVHYFSNVYGNRFLVSSYFHCKI